MNCSMKIKFNKDNFSQGSSRVSSADRVVNSRPPQDKYIPQLVIKSELDVRMPALIGVGTLVGPKQ